MRKEKKLYIAKNSITENLITENSITNLNTNLLNLIEQLLACDQIVNLDQRETNQPYDLTQ